MNKLFRKDTNVEQPIHEWLLDHLNITEGQKVELLAVMEDEAKTKQRKAEVLVQLNLLSLKKPELREPESEEF
jgi:hypothetical protein